LPPGNEAEVRPARHGAVGWEVRGQVADPLAHLARIAEDVVAGHARAPARGRHEAGEDPHGRRFAGAVGPEEADDVARRNAGRHVADGGERAVILGELLDFDHTEINNRGLYTLGGAT